MPLADTGARVVGTLRRDEGGWRRFLTSAGEAYAAGADVDIVPAGRPVDLPTYAFEQHRFWLEADDPATAGTTADPVDERFWTAVEDGDLTTLAADLGVTEEDHRNSLGTMLPLLAGWRRRERTQAAADAWRYRITWRRLAEPAAVHLAGTWLLAATPGTDIAEVADAITGHGGNAVRLEVGTDPAALARELLDAAAGGVRGVVSLLAADRGAHPDAPHVTAGLAATLTLVQAMDAAQLEAPLWMITRNAGTDPTQAAIQGLGRVAGLEHPQRWGGLVDLSGETDARTSTRLAGVLAGIGDEDQISIRPDGIQARRLTHAPVPAGSPGKRWQPHGTVLITGGTGALGAHVARKLAADGAEHLLLTGRRGASAPGTGELIAELIDLGARVTVAACDAADRDALAAVLADIPDELPLTAVVHAAGVGDVAALTDTDLALADRMLAGKAAGARHLDDLLGDTPLDAFVLFSSNAGLIGGAGQGAYAAANAALDAVAAGRRARGRTATTISWGLWGGGSGLGEAGDEEYVLRRGLRPMDPPTAVTAMIRAVEQDDTSIAVADVDWERFATAFTASRSRPLIGDLPEVRAALTRTEAPAGTTASALAARLAGVADAERPGVVLALVREQAAAILGHHDSDGIEPTRAFRDLGFDSLTAVEMRNRLSAATGVRLPSTLVFDHPNAAAVADFLLAEVFGTSAGDTETAPAARPLDDEPIVIVGMACRFPGDVESPEQLWDLVAQGRDAMGEFPTDRGWDLAAIYHPDPAHPGTTYTRQGAFVRDAGGFDAGFFGISPREALAMDPQQRLLLEASWETFERAGIDPATLRGTATGVFVGASSQGYGSETYEIPEEAQGYFITGGQTAVISGRVSYVLGLEGPAMTVDTACSSSLVAMHLAAQSLRQGECTLALAGGVNVMAGPGAFIEFSRQRGMAADGRCKPFAAAADGTGWGEGVGLLLLERLSDAQANGHRILAVVRGSAVNQDGASNGLSAPNGPSQARVIRQALASAGLRPSDVDAVEAHGTGTTLGDPIEAQALLATYGQDRAGGEPLWLGSIKSNIGHTQTAAGVAGVIKMVMAMQHGVLPASLHVDEPTPHVDWESGEVELLAAGREWPVVDRPRRAGVSSFGVSGTNAHVIVEQAPVVAPVARRVVSGPVLAPLSGRSGQAVLDSAARLGGWSGELVDLGWSLASTRAQLPYRAAVVAADGDGWRSALASVVPAVARSGGLGVLFTGQGAQRSGMGRGLYEAFPVFAAAFDEVCAALDEFLPSALRDVVFGGGELLDQTLWTQAGLFAVETALFRLVESWGVRPDFVAGHSVGEIVAAHVAGVLSLGDAARLVTARGRLMQALPVGGAMAALAGTELEVAGRGVDVAAVNSPGSVVVSGAEAAVDALVEEWKGQGRRARRLSVSHAFHSALMEPMLAEFGVITAELEYQRPQLAVVSNVTGAVIEQFDAEYWVRHVRQAVRFADSVAYMADAGVSRFLELGPDGVLSGMGQQCVDALFVPALRRDRDEPQSLLTAIGRLWESGIDLDWTALYAGRDGQTVDLPTYPFQHDHYWLRLATTGDVTSAGITAADHPLLAAVVALPKSGEVVLTGRISTGTVPWLRDHTVLGSVLFPGTGFVELAIRAGDEVGHGHLEELTLQAPLVIADDDAVVLRVVVGAESGGRRSVTIYSQSGDGWIGHATGLLTQVRATALADTQWPPAGARAIAVDDLYPNAAEQGFAYGPAFRGLRAAWRRGTDVFAEVSLPEDAEAGGYGLHPALLDAALHAIGLGELFPDDGKARLPFAWNGVTLHAAGATHLRVHLSPAGGDAIALTATDPSGVPVVVIDELAFRAVSAGQLETRPAEHLYRLDWTAGPASDAEWDGTLVHVDGLDVDGLTGSPDAAVLTAPDSGSPAADVTAVLAAAQHWLADHRFASSRLVVVTGTDPGQAAIAGLVRSAENESPGRFLIVAADAPVPDGLLRAALAAGEPEVAVRDGALLV
ncbi:type I polyketide synthase, partial [Actinoplanes regularis]|uniref:type I polyketide synthase n=1 Tax=Actinoplanes regularis TaxID=52697 RepID=UPI001943EC46